MIFIPVDPVAREILKIFVKKGFYLCHKVKISAKSPSLNLFYQHNNT
jgi:hypothetical protein